MEKNFKYSLKREKFFKLIITAPIKITKNYFSNWYSELISECYSALSFSKYNKPVNYTIPIVVRHSVESYASQHRQALKRRRQK